MKIIALSFCELFLEHYRYLVIDSDNVCILNNILKTNNSGILNDVLTCLLQLLEIPEANIIFANYFSRKDVKNIFLCYINNKNRIITEKTLQVLIKLKT